MFVPDKKALMTIIYGQYDKAAKTKTTLGETYKVYCQDRNLIKFLKQVHTVCIGSDNRRLYFVPYKQAVVVKLMNNYSNNKSHNFPGFKEEVKIKYNAVKVMIEKFPNRTGVMIELLGVERPTLDLVAYCTMFSVDQLV